MTFEIRRMARDDVPEVGRIGVEAFNDLMARTPELQSVIVPIGDGLWVGVRL